MRQRRLVLVITGLHGGCFHKLDELSVTPRLVIQTKAFPKIHSTGKDGMMETVVGSVFPTLPKYIYFNKVPGSRGKGAAGLVACEACSQDMELKENSPPALLLWAMSLKKPTLAQGTH